VNDGSGSDEAGMGAMRRLLRVVRGAIGMGLTWALGWFGAGMVLRLFIGSGGGDVPIPIVFGMFGFVSGVTFSGILKLAAGHRRFDELSLGRFAAGGAVGGLILSGILAATAGPGGDPLWLVPALALAGAASAAGTLSLARRAEAPRLLATDASIDSLESETGQLP
jgi:hypothetical protein